MTQYKVELFPTAKEARGVKHTLLLKDYDELVKLIQNLDTTQYRLGVAVNVTETVFIDFNDFCKKDPNLEIGQQ